jgi:hypothetical protein
VPQLDGVGPSLLAASTTILRSLRRPGHLRLLSASHEDAEQLSGRGSRPAGSSVPIRARLVTS